MKRFLYLILGALILLLLLRPLLAVARYEEQPAYFINYEQFHKPRQPYGPQKPAAKIVSADKNSVRAVSRKAPAALRAAPDAPGGRHYSSEEVKAFIVEYSRQHGIESDTPLCIAEKESSFNHLAKNKRSSAAGVFQYLDSTWRATDEGKAGYSVFQADKNVLAAIKYMAIHKKTKPWTVHLKCPPLTFL